MSVKAILIASLFCFVFQTSWAQSDEQAYSEEFTYGINFNTNAGLIGGFAFKWAKQVKPKQYRSFGFELVNVKHPKEYKFRNDVTGNMFIAFKSHYLFSFRPYYGREFVLFGKAPEEGVHINAIVAGGPSIGIRKPYYVLYVDVPTSPNSAVSVPYDTSLNDNQIYGVGNFSDGFNELTFTAGVHAKSSLTFEFGQIKSSVIGVELGVLAEQFAKKQVIIPYVKNRSFFTSAFITLYYGKKN